MSYSLHFKINISKKEDHSPILNNTKNKYCKHDFSQNSLLTIFLGSRYDGEVEMVYPGVSIYQLLLIKHPPLMNSSKKLCFGACSFVYLFACVCDNSNKKE